LFFSKAPVKKTWAGQKDIKYILAVGYVCFRTSIFPIKNCFIKSWLYVAETGSCRHVKKLWRCSWQYYKSVWC